MASAVKASLPTQVTKILGQARSFAMCRLQKADQKTICGLPKVQDTQYVVVVGEDAIMHVFILDPNSGGECQLIKTHRLVNYCICTWLSSWNAELQ